MKTLTRSIHHPLPLLAGLALLLGAAATARAQAPTVITSLPYVITARGTYVLNNDLSSAQTSGNLIEIKASNVTLDFQGHFISGPVANTSQNTGGVFAEERSNLTIRNGTVANCTFGVVLAGNNATTTNSLNHELDRLRITRCNSIGIQLTNSPGSTITNCKLSQIGVSGGSGADGININGPGVTVQGCVISQAVGTNSVAIFLDGGSFARQNTISDFTIGVRIGKYQDNLTFGCTTPFLGGTDAGGNN